jgi:deoxyadenosine/deoxycytidine kinase
MPAYPLIVNSAQHDGASDARDHRKSALAPLVPARATAPIPPSGPLLVCIEGGIAVGKSSLMAYLRDHASPDEPVEFADEPAEAWQRAGLLSAYYNRELTPATFQLCVLATRFDALQRALRRARCSGARLIYSERSLASDAAVFAAMNLHGADMAAYQLAYDSLVRLLPPLATATVWLDTSTQTSWARQQRRGRTSERAVTIGLHADLRAMYSVYFHTLCAPRLRLTSEEPLADVAARTKTFAHAAFRIVCPEE